MRDCDIHTHLLLTMAAILIALMAIIGIEMAWGGEMVFVNVSATVLPSARMEVFYQASSLTITNSDIAQGYVDVPMASMFQVKNNSRNGYAMTFENTGICCREVHITGMGSDVIITSGSDVVIQPYIKPIVLELNYRFILSNNAQAGIYDWPVNISVKPL